MKIKLLFFKETKMIKLKNLWKVVLALMVMSAMLVACDTTTGGDSDKSDSGNKTENNGGNGNGGSDNGGNGGSDNGGNGGNGNGGSDNGGNAGDNLATGVYKYELLVDDISGAWGGSAENPAFSVMLLNDATLQACVDAGDFKQATAVEPEYQVGAFGNMKLASKPNAEGSCTANAGSYAVYGGNPVNDVFQYYNGIAVTIDEEGTFTLYVDMSKLVKTQLKGLWKDEGNGDEAVMTDQDIVELDGYKPYVIALGDDVVDEDNYIMTGWSASLMKMEEGATFPTEELKKEAPAVPVVADINCIVGTITGWDHTPMTDNTYEFGFDADVTADVNAATQFAFTNGDWGYRFSNAVVEALDVEVDLAEDVGGNPAHVTFAADVLEVGKDYTVTFIPGSDNHSAKVKVSAK